MLWVVLLHAFEHSSAVILQNCNCIGMSSMFPCTTKSLRINAWGALQQFVIHVHYRVSRMRVQQEEKAAEGSEVRGMSVPPPHVWRCPSPPSPDDASGTEPRTSWWTSRPVYRRPRLKHMSYFHKAFYLFIFFRTITQTVNNPKELRKICSDPYAFVTCRAGLYTYCHIAHP